MKGVKKSGLAEICLCSGKKMIEFIEKSLMLFF